MGLIHDLARKLAAALKESPENKSFQTARNQARTDPRAEKLITEFRTRQMEIQALHLQGKKPDPRQVKDLEKMAQEVQAHPVTRTYFEAEARLGQLWTDVQAVLAQAIGMEAQR